MFTLRPRQRIKKRKEFLQIQESGKKSRTRHFLISVVPNQSERQTSRIGITITKKVDKRAVGRNYVKRHVREFFRHQRDNLRSDFDIVVVALSGSSALTREEITRELWGAFRKGKLFKDSRSQDRRSRGKKPSKTNE